MSEYGKIPGNVIPVDFKIKRYASPGKKAECTNPFAMFVDENSENIDDFCNALLASAMDFEKNSNK